MDIYKSKIEISKKVNVGLLEISRVAITAKISR